MGSLFKVRDYWSVRYNEEYDTHSMIVANVDNDKNGMEKIVVGSFQGILRIFYPRQKGFEPHDLLLEKDFGMPILQVIVGNFSPKTKRKQIGILFPKKLVIAVLLTSTGGKEPQEEMDDEDALGNTNGGSKEKNNNPLLDRIYVLRILSEFALEHTAYNCCVRPIREAAPPTKKGEEPPAIPDSICVQSMDGQMAFFDHQKLLFARFIPQAEFLVPGHLLYVPSIDSIVTNSSTNSLLCYKYSTFVNATGSTSKDQAPKADIPVEGDSTFTTTTGGGNRVAPTAASTRGPDQTGKRMSPDWTFNVGEDIMDIICCQMEKPPSSSSSSSRKKEPEIDIVALGEHTLFVVKQDGTLRFNKRMDVATSSLCAFPVAKKKADNFIVCTHTNALMVFSEKALEWSANMPAMPLRVAVTKIGKVEGMIVAICDDGTISANYLGTDPASNPVQLLESKDLDYAAIDEEHRRLQQQIKKAVTTGKEEPKDLLRVQIDPPLSGRPPQPGCTATIHLAYGASNVEVKNVVITLGSPEPIFPDQPSIVIPSIPANDSVTIPLAFTVQTDSTVLPSSLLVDVAITYQIPSGDTLSSQTGFLLPLTLLGCAVPVLKTNDVRVQIDTNKEPPHLAELFRGLSEYSQDIQANAMSFQFQAGGDATILVSKNGGRYRIQASSFEALWLLLSELLRLLRGFHRDGEPLVVSVPDDLPLEDYMMAVDRHFECRQRLVEAQESMATVAAQFRAIQKRLLVKYRDKNPAPLASFEYLFESTYRKLHSSAETVEVCQVALKMASSSLSCNTHLLLLLLRYKYQHSFSREDFDILKNCLTPNVTSKTDASGWEETVDASLAYLLRTSLSKSSKDSGAVAQPLMVMAETTKLHKHIALVIDRISKGGTLADKSAAKVAAAVKKDKFESAVAVGAGSASPQRPPQEEAQPKAAADGGASETLSFE